MTALAIEITLWIFTESQTGKSCLDKQLSFLNSMFKLFIGDGNDNTTEEYMFHALQYKGTMDGTSGILLDESTLNEPTFKNKFKAATGSRSTH